MWYLRSQHYVDIICVWQIGWLTLKEEFNRMLGSGQTDKEHDRVFDALKAAVRDDSMKKHQWDNKAEDSLVHLWCIPSCLMVLYVIFVWSWNHAHLIRLRRMALYKCVFDLIWFDRDEPFQHEDEAVGDQISFFYFAKNEYESKLHCCRCLNFVLLYSMQFCSFTLCSKSYFCARTEVTGMAREQKNENCSKPLKCRKIDHVVYTVL